MSYFRIFLHKLLFFLARRNEERLYRLFCVFLSFGSRKNASELKIKNARPSASNFKSFSRSLGQFFSQQVRTILEIKYHFSFHPIYGNIVQKSCQIMPINLSFSKRNRTLYFLLFQNVNYLYVLKTLLAFKPVISMKLKIS